jgi:cobalt-precorrin 5A hydrolase/precorrin-3B C17-methyltransferase
MGTGSVAEAAALLSSGPNGQLKLHKRITHANDAECGAVTVAIAESMEAHAPQRGELHLIGSGPGDLALLTPDARKALERCPAWVGYGLYLDLLEPLRRSDQIRLDGQLTMERDRCQQALSLACQGVRVALVSSGDSGIYGMAGLALELWLDLPEDERPRFAVHPGISALQLAAAKAGAPLMHDFCTVSLSDRLTPWEVIERRLEGAAKGDFVVALYNPRSKGRDWQLQRAKDILLTERPVSTPVVMARQLGRQEEHVSFCRLDSLPVESVDMLTVLIIGNSSSRLDGGRMVTPRGYPGAELS